MRLLLVCLVSISCLIGLGFKLTGYKSAFEADQACHFEKTQNYGDDKRFDCDHDLETRQWLLYQKGDENELSVVLKRYRY